MMVLQVSAAVSVAPSLLLEFASPISSNGWYSDLPFCLVGPDAEPKCSAVA